jgi:hypothetical protein
MIYSVTKFRHYLLGKRFTFHVDHSALVYLVSKASLTGKLARWAVLLQEYEFNIVHRPGAQHAVADYLSHLESVETPAGVADDFPDVGVVTVTPEARPRDDPDKWLTNIIYFLSHGVLPAELSKAERKGLGVHSRAFSLMNESLYHKSADGVWRHVVWKDEQEDVLRECHNGVAGWHYASEVTARKVWQSKLWWPTVLRDAHLFAKECDLCQRMGQPQSRHGCRISPFFCLNPSRNGALILSAHFIMQRPRQVIGIYSLRRIIARTGWRQKLYATKRRRPPLNSCTSTYGVDTDAP